MRKRLVVSRAGPALLLALVLSLSPVASAAAEPAASARAQAAAAAPTTEQVSEATPAKKGLKGKLLGAAGRGARSFGGKVDRLGDWLDGKGANLRQSKGGKFRLAGVIGGSGRTLKLLLGTETLLNTSFEIGGGLSIASPLLTRFANANTGAAFWSGSVAFHEKGIKDVMVNRWLSMDCPLGGVGYSRLGKFGMSISGLPLVSGYKSQRSHAVYVGVGGAAEVGIGEVGAGKNAQGQAVPARGPYMEGYLSVPVLPLGFVNAYAGMVFSFYSPALRPITKYMEKPAHWLHKQGQKYQAAIAKRSAPLVRLGSKAKNSRVVKATAAASQRGLHKLAQLRPSNRLAKQPSRPGPGGRP